MKATTSGAPAPQQNDHTRLYFNIFMGLIGLALAYMIVLLFAV